MSIVELNKSAEYAPINLPIGFEKGQVFTPKFLAIWVAEVLREHLGKCWSGRVLDPACGDGELLAAVVKKLPNAELFGVDIDAVAAHSAQLRLCELATIKTDDMLLSPSFENCEKLHTFDAVISNPPWGADLLHSRTFLKQLGYSLASGQFDSWSLFVEATLKVLAKEGIAAFILPDAIFAHEHRSTRAWIAKDFSIELIARLGEGIFKGVFRGTTVLIVRNRQPKAEHRTEVFRLAKAQRAAVMSGNLDLQEARICDRHYVSQSRFMSDTSCRWDIDVRSSDQEVLRKLDAKAGRWSEFFVSGRGVELSKKGLVKACANCGHATPAPTRPRSVKCAGCGVAAHSDEMLTKRVVVNESEKISNFIPFVVGEDINRYGLSCSRRIELDVPGINYKNQEIYTQERLLVRKTGIGLKATITNRVAASNQVVFHYLPRSREFSFYLYYVLGVLSSRIMFAYHLRKSGENEWRSHPYVTPRYLASLPIPTPKVGTQSERQAVAIADRVKNHLREHGQSKKLDLEIEGLVAGLYKLNHSDLDWVKKVICDAQSLEPMRVLSDFDINSISIEMVQ